MVNLPETLSRPTRRALAKAGITELEQLSEMSDSELIQLHGFDTKGLLLLKEALADVGLSTAQEPRGAPSSPESQGAKSGVPEE